MNPETANYHRPEPARDATRSAAKWSSKIRVALLVSVLAALAIIQRSGVMDGSIDSWVDPSEDGRPCLVAARYHRQEGPTHTSLDLRLRNSWDNLAARFGKRNAAATSFDPGTNVNTVQGMLDECMNLTGTRYLIAKEVRYKLVSFEHTNVLNGYQWEAAAQEALRRDGLLVLREEGVVKIIPEDKLAAYQIAGLARSLGRMGASCAASSSGGLQK